MLAFIELKTVVKYLLNHEKLTTLFIWIVENVESVRAYICECVALNERNREIEHTHKFSNIYLEIAGAKTNFKRCLLKSRLVDAHLLCSQ